ncbi:MAG: hypothetical protein MK291_09990 [Planctomycetes bacterium]|nr:hypothetical protein [Planctomycetota bacterium]
MLRSSLFAASAVLLSTAAFAQNDASSKLRPVTSPVKDAGTYHVATGTWTRAKAPTANLGPDTLYNNTCLIGFYVALSSVETLVDSGRLPSTSSVDGPNSVPGSADVYTVNGFQISYCATNALVDIDVAHYECYSPCSDATLLVPNSSISLVGLPGGGGSASALGCWILDIDIQGSTAEFDLQGDCDQLYDAAATTDNFGWAQTETNPNGAPGGPLLAGDPYGILAAGPAGTGCPYGDGTVFVGSDATLTQGTGLGSDDVFETDLGGAYAGCWFFGGYLSGAPYASFNHVVYGDAGGGGGGAVGTVYCVGDGSGATACPCANNSTNGGGCANGTGNGAIISGSGSASLANANLVLSGTGATPSQPGLFFQGNNAINSGDGIQFGDGLRCSGGAVIRLQVRFADSNGESATTIDVGAVGANAAGDVKRYQLWYRDPNATPCGGTFNLSNGLEITWAA